MVYSARWQNFIIKNLFSYYQMELARSLSHVIKHNTQLCHLIFSLWKQGIWIEVLLFFIKGNTSEDVAKIILKVMKPLLDLIFRLENVNTTSNFSSFILQFPWHKCIFFLRKSITGELSWAKLLYISRTCYPF